MPHWVIKGENAGAPGAPVQSRAAREAGGWATPLKLPYEVPRCGVDSTVTFATRLQKTVPGGNTADRLPLAFSRLNAF